MTIMTTKDDKAATFNLADLDAAFNDEILHVSMLEYNSHEICSHFYVKLRQRLAAATSAPLTRADAPCKCRNIFEDCTYEKGCRGRAAFAQQSDSADDKALAVPPIYVEVRECSGCGHIGINDSPSDICACNTCGWVGPYQQEDHCPECKRDGTMTSACPECRDYRTRLLVDADLPLPAAPVVAAQPQEADNRQCYSCGRPAHEHGC